MSGGRKQLRILIVEDEALVAMMLEDIVTELGHQVVAIVGQLPRAIESARTLEVDLAILDLNLNGQRTDELPPILTARGIPFVFATGYGAAGVDPAWAHVPVLQKPFQPRDLEIAIERALAR